ncbi:MAG: hypothetical protein D6732_21140 [Methanobacteriota archaeon]|nr:MAG: hypothetical protein D6732_21140 [Euryarchaeota archaeon]
MAEELAMKATVSAVQNAGPAVANRLKALFSRKKNKFAGFPLLNLSGHPLTSKAISILESEFGINQLQIIEIKVGSVNVKKIIDFTENLVEQIYEKIGDKLLTGEYLVIPPGFAPLSLSLFAFLHGITGHFPHIVILQKENTTYVPTSVIDLQSIRDTARESR